MAGRPLGRKNIRSYLASEELDRLDVNLIQAALDTVKEFDKIADMNIQAFEGNKANNAKYDTGAAYLANALRAVSEKAAIYMKLASFKYPTLSRVSIKEIRKEEEQITARIISAAEIRQAILDDPFASEENMPVFELPKGEMLS